VRPGEPADHALGRSRGGFSTKIHLVCDAKGRPIGAEISAGQDHETTRFASLVDRITIRGARGRPRKRPDALAGDKGYSAGWTRAFLRERKIKPIIPTRKDEVRDPSFDRERYRERNFVERCIGWLKEARRIATRYEKLATHYLAMLTIGMIMQYL
jgi:transposase